MGRGREGGGSRSSPEEALSQQARKEHRQREVALGAGAGCPEQALNARPRD